MPSRGSTLRLAALTLALVGVASGCTDEQADPPPPPPDTSTADVRQGLAALWAGDNPTAEDTTAADCFAEAFQARTTTEQLRKTGIIDASESVVTALPILDPGIAGVWVDAQFACVDYVEESTRALATQTRGSIDQRAYASCLEESLTEGQIRAALVAGLSGDPDNSALDVLSRAQGSCAAAAVSVG